MKKCISRISILWLLSIICVNQSFGQSAQDSTYLNNTQARVIANYNKSIGQQSRLYNGIEYEPYDRTVQGAPLYPLDALTWEPGEVNYDGITYKDVPMKYDIYRDVLVALLYNHFSPYVLLKERVRDFSLRGLHFVRVETDSLAVNRSEINSGYYEQLYGGKLEVLAKRSKTMQSSPNVTVNEIYIYFLSHNEYYLKKGNDYHKVSSESSFLKILKDKKPQLQQFIKDNNIRFRKDPEAAMVKIAAYYDRLTN